MVGGAGADDVVSFEDGFANNRRLQTPGHHRDGGHPDSSQDHTQLAGSMSMTNMNNFCQNFINQINLNGNLADADSTGSDNFGVTLPTPFTAAAASSGQQYNPNPVAQHVGVTRVTKTDTDDQDVPIAYTYEQHDKPSTATRRLSSTPEYKTEIKSEVAVTNRDKIRDECKNFLRDMRTASVTALASVKTWMQETERIRGLARANCLTGQERQAQFKTRRTNAINAVDRTAMQQHVATVKTSQENWCKARDAEVLALTTEYHKMEAKIQEDISSPSFTGPTVNRNGYNAGADWSTGAFAASVGNPGYGETQWRKGSNSVADSDAADHMDTKKSNIATARVALGTDNTVSFDAFIVDPTYRSWNIICDVIKRCQVDHSTPVKVSRSANLRINGRPGVVAGVVNDLATLTPCGNTKVQGNKDDVADNPETCANGYYWDEATTSSPGNFQDIYQTIDCTTVDGVTESGTYNAGDPKNREEVRDQICIDEGDCRTMGLVATGMGCVNTKPETRHELILKTCSTYSDPFIRSKRLQYTKLEGTAEHVISASANSYFAYLTDSKKTMASKRNAEYAALNSMEIDMNTYAGEYLNYAERLMEANSKNQEYMEMVLEAEIVKLAYEQFQDTVKFSQTSSQMTFSKDQENLFLGQQFSAEFAATECDANGENCRPKYNLGINGDTTSDILQSSAMFSTTNKWFGLAQLNLEAILASTDAKQTCGCSTGWASCTTNSVKDFNTGITEFWPTGRDISGAKDICELLKSAYSQAMRVQQERKAALAVLAHLSAEENTAWKSACDALNVGAACNADDFA